jgi:AraC-like DNA-binding protein
MIEFGLVLVDGVFAATRTPGDAPPLRGHLEWQWDHLRSGRMRIRTAAGEHDLLPGASVLSPPWLAHTFLWHEDSVSSSIHFVWPEAPRVPTSGPIVFEPEGLEPFLLERFFRHVRYSDSEERRNAACAFHLLLGEGLRRIFPARTDCASLADRVRTLLEERAYAPVGVREMARHVHLSTTHFIRRFREETGTSPGAYIRACRIERAKDLLAWSDWNVTAVALGLGYADLYTFSKAFRREVGMPPSAWLERMRAGRAG